jgi:hypothetical protein
MAVKILNAQEVPEQARSLDESLAKPPEGWELLWTCLRWQSDGFCDASEGYQCDRCQCAAFGVLPTTESGQSFRTMVQLEGYAACNLLRLHEHAMEQLQTVFPYGRLIPIGQQFGTCASYSPGRYNEIEINLCFYMIPSVWGGWITHQRLSKSWGCTQS